MRILQNISQSAMQPKLASFSIIFSINQDSSASRLKESAGKIDQCGFSCTSFSNNRHICSSWNFQAKVTEHLFLTIRIPERNIVKFDISLNWLPVFCFRMEAVTILFDNFRCIHNVRFLIQQSHNTFNVWLNCNDICQNTRHLLNRLKDRYRVGCECGQGTNQNAMFQHQISSSCQNNCCCSGACQHNKRNIQSIKSCCTNGCIAHFFGQLRKFMRIFVLNNQCLRGFSTHDSLIESSGNAGVDRTNLSVPEQNSLLEVGS